MEADRATCASSSANWPRNRSIPKDGTIEKLVDLKAEKLARKIVLRTNQNMKLEDQGIGDEKIAKTIKELAIEIKREMKKSLWD